jgi:hypothetical protein
MIVKHRIALSIVLFLAGVAMGQQSSAYILTKFPLAAVAADSQLWVEWTGIARPGYTAPDSGILYFDRSPGGSKIENYRYKVEKFCSDTTKDGPLSGNNRIINGYPPKRGIKFRPIDQTGMGAGVFYYTVAFKMKILGKDTVFYSNEMQMIVETDKPVTTRTPIGNTSELTPTFTWDANPGVPYYHIILSDEPLAIDTTGGKSSGLKVSGLSIIWQAITPRTQITYGAPDPSGTITASPPPLSPGQTFSWVVLNNYGNQMAFTSTKYGLPKSFTIEGVPLTKPAPIFPLKDTTFYSQIDSIITFKWTNLDPKANTYKVYLYMSYGGAGTENIDAKLVIWENEVTAGGFAGANGVIDKNDTGWVSINARNVLTNNHYTWKVFAIDNKGASTASDIAKFVYSAPAMGKMELFTREKIVTSSGAKIDTIIMPVSAVEMQVEVLNGSLEAALLFYTDLSGNLSRERPAGAYRITANKNGFEPLSKTVTLDSAATVAETFFLKRPDATVYGKVEDSAVGGINAATVTAVSERNDTVITSTDALGSFIVNCYAGDWFIRAEKTGYVNSLPKQIAVVYGQNVNFGSIRLKSNPFTVSGSVKNSGNNPILGANVKIIREGQVIDEYPSTSQDGSFSFSISPGSYTVYATKTGFATYNKNINVSSSMQLSIIMPAGAALLNGYVYGRSWVGAGQVLAPITGASVLFTSSTVADTFSTQSDATYGDYRISVPGGRMYKMTSSAPGFVAHSRFLPDTVRAQSTVTSFDTLNGLGMLAGSVRMGPSKAPVEGATVNLIDKIKNTVAASTKSQASGYFEVRNLPDGSYIIKAGADGYVTDSIVDNDTLYVSSGKTTIEGRVDAESLVVYMNPGSKAIRWVVDGGADTTALVKIKSPLLKTLSVKDTFHNAGAGAYIVSVDGAADSIIDLSYHVFTVEESETDVHGDSVTLPAYNATKDTLRMTGDTITLMLRSLVTLDSVVVYYKDVTSLSFDAAAIREALQTYTFKVRPQKDGSVLTYFFKAFKGKDEYGYNQEVFNSFVAPDSNRLTKLEITPSAGDTILLPSDYQMTFTIRGYFGSQFSPASRMDSTGITWQLPDPAGNSLVKKTGLTAVLKTASAASQAAIQLKAIIDTTLVKIDRKWIPDPQFSLYFRTTGKKIASLQVRRVDAQNPFPITTSSLSRAEFVSEGLDVDKNVFAISSSWNISPAGAGVISPDGTFRPDKKFSGRVRIWAQSGSFSGEFGAAGTDPSTYGLEVQHIVSQSREPDTVSNLNGCTIIFPDSVVPADKSALVQISMPTVRNQVARTTGVQTVIGSVYEINELNDVVFQKRGGDSIEIVLDVPQGLNTGNTMSIGNWNDDSLTWELLANSKTSVDNRTVRAAVTHFSRYAILSRSGNLQSTFSVSPNPFSPLRSPSEFPTLALKFGPNAPKGACISFLPDAPDQKLKKVRIRIYSIQGDLICSVINQNAPKMVQYNLWWDGCASQGDVLWDNLIRSGDEYSKMFPASGRRMCQNGRYFVVLTTEDAEGKEKSYMKQIVLVK